MPRLFFGNFGFEEELADDRRNLPVSIARLEAELAPCWAAVAEAADFIWCPEPVDSRFAHRALHSSPRSAVYISDQRDIPRGLELVPWGWSGRARDWGGLVQAETKAPPPPAVRTANSRRFALSLESRWNCGLHGAVEISTLSELHDLLRRIDRRASWVIKPDFSGAARGRLLGEGSDLLPEQVNWLRKRFEQHHVLIWEPWGERIEEAGLQWTIPAAGVPVFEGLTGLCTDPIGRYIGSLFGDAAPPIDEWSEAVDLSGRLATELQQRGYFGPLGVDAMRYRDVDGNTRLRPLQDVNARLTMGRLSLGWQTRFASGLWRHGTAAESAAAEQAGVLLLRTSPETISGAPVQHCTWIESVHSPEDAADQSRSG